MADTSVLERTTQVEPHDGDRIGAAADGSVRRYEELEGVRGIAALLVVLYHLPYWHPVVHLLPVVDNGSYMVQLFFVMSGFVISGAYRRRLTTPRALFDFQCLRFGRLYPVHVLILGFFLILEFAKLLLERRYGIASNNTQPFVHNNWTAFFQQVFLVQAMGPTGNALTFNSPAWSVGVEFYIYLLFGLILLVVPRWFVALAAAITIASLTWMALHDPGEWIFVCRGLAGFFLGCLVQQAVIRTSGRWTRRLLAAAIAVFAVFMCVRQTEASALLIYPIAAMIVMGIAAGPDNAPRRVLRSPAFAWLGRISYSVYMAHAGVIWVVSQVVRFTQPHPVRFALSPLGHYDVQLSFATSLFACGAVVVVTLAVGTVVCLFIEEPFRDATRRWVAARR